MDGFDADEEDEEEIDSDKDMGLDDEDGNEVSSLELQKLAAEVLQSVPSLCQQVLRILILILDYFVMIQARGFQPADEDDDSDDDFSDDEELQSPIDEVDPFIFFVETIQGKF